jgi:hypothetical protein
MQHPVDYCYCDVCTTVLSSTILIPNKYLAGVKQKSKMAAPYDGP